MFTSAFAPKECFLFQSRQEREAASCQVRDPGGGRTGRALAPHKRLPELPVLQARPVLKGVIGVEAGLLQSHR